MRTAHDICFTFVVCDGHFWKFIQRPESRLCRDVVGLIRHLCSRFEVRCLMGDGYNTTQIMPIWSAIIKWSLAIIKIAKYESNSSYYLFIFFPWLVHLNRFFVLVAALYMGIIQSFAIDFILSNRYSVRLIFCFIIIKHFSYLNILPSLPPSLFFCVERRLNKDCGNLYQFCEKYSILFCFGLWVAVVVIVNECVCVLSNSIMWDWVLLVASPPRYTIRFRGDQKKDNGECVRVIRWQRKRMKKITDKRCDPSTVKDGDGERMERRRQSTKAMVRRYV